MSAAARELLVEGRAKLARLKWVPQWPNRERDEVCVLTALHGVATPVGLEAIALLAGAAGYQEPIGPTAAIWLGFTWNDTVCKDRSEALDLYDRAIEAAG